MYICINVFLENLPVSGNGGESIDLASNGINTPNAR